MKGHHDEGTDFDVGIERWVCEGNRRARAWGSNWLRKGRASGSCTGTNQRRSAVLLTKAIHAHV